MGRGVDLWILLPKKTSIQIEYRTWERLNSTHSSRKNLTIQRELVYIIKNLRTRFSVCRGLFEND